MFRIMERHELPVTIGPDGREAAVRVSDGERERVVDLLSAHAAEGRLTLEELDARIDGAYAARTRGELRALLTDLPAAVPDARPDAAPRRRAPRSLAGLSSPVATFVAVNLVLVAVWALSGAGYFWPVWSILGWGLALAKPGGCARRRTAYDEPATRLTRATGGRA